MLLLSMSDYVSKVEKEINSFDTRDARALFYFDKIILYNNFLKRRLSLDIFDSDKYFKGFYVQNEQKMLDWYGGIRIYNNPSGVPASKWFSEVFVNGKPRYLDKVEDLIGYHIELSDCFFKNI